MSALLNKTMHKKSNMKSENNSATDPNDEEISELEHLRKLFIGGLAPYTTEESLKEFYEQWGKIVDVVVMRDTATKRSRGFGFITYTKAFMVDKAQDARPHIVDGKVVEAKRALPRPEREKRETNVTVKKLFVGGLKDNHDEACLEEYFQQFGNVVGVKILTDKSSGKRRGFAFVEFDDYDAVDKAILQPSHSIKYVLVDVKKSVYKLDRNKPGMAPGPSNGTNMPPPVAAPPYPQQQPPMMMNNGPPMNYNGWGPAPPQNYNNYNQQPPPQMNNWNYPPANAWNGGMPPQPPPQAQGNWNPTWPNATGPMPNGGMPPQQPMPQQQNQPPLPPQQQQPPQQTPNWNSGPPVPPAQQANFGTGYQQNYGGGPTKNTASNSNRMNPYNNPPSNNYGGGNVQQQGNYGGYNNAPGPASGPGGMNMQQTPGNSAPQMPGPVPPVGGNNSNRRY